MENREQSKKKFILAGVFLTGAYGVMNAIAKKRTESIDDGNPYIKAGKTEKRTETFYEGKMKPMLDKVFSFGGLVILSPLYALISLAVYLDDPGPVFFTQKRVGKDKKFFYLHKFRSMKMSTPHDVPTHQLSDPEQYITRVGRILRKTSLDELPQIWDIFRGRMSIIGPRPALWNQEDLVRERDKFSANNVVPGLTGWAQINGRDKLEISYKANLDGEYVRHLRQGGIDALLFDMKCFIGTIWSVVGGDGVVEGGTGEIHKKKSISQSSIRTEPVRADEKTKYTTESMEPADAGFEDYGYRKKFVIDTSASNKKRVLITGANSYIGKSFEAYVKEHYSENFVIDTVDMIGDAWREKDFSQYDCVFHVAGIAHADIGKVNAETRAKYYFVNTELAVDTARKAKAEGVSQFIFMSSMIIYGEAVSFGKQKCIDEHTLPAPANFYGDSKWQADKQIRRLKDIDFHVAVLRPPMIYGKESKGNYPILEKWAKKLPIFPDVDNCRSMLYIENLCEFISLLALSGEGGIFFPQNQEYTKTSRMVKEINNAVNRNIYITRLLNPTVYVGSRVPGKINRYVNKAFGNLTYSKKLSCYSGLDYQIKTLKESVKSTEEKVVTSKSVLMLVNHDVVIYNFRLELVERLLADGYKVHISSPYGERIEDLIALGAEYHEIDMNRHGMNPLEDFAILKEYKKLIATVHPMIIFGYTIKPNIYGAIEAKAAHIPFVANITGLGTAVENGGFRQNLIILFYKYAFTNVQTVFFQNEQNQEFFRRQRIALGKYKLLPGSGVNLERYPITEYPECSDGKSGAPIQFAFISRIMKEKGIEQYLAAAEEIQKRYPATEFHVCGFCEAEYKGMLAEMEEKGVVIYHGMIRDVAEFMSKIHCVVHPTYYPEGISNVLLEACSSGRPVITTDRAGCREVVDDGGNGYLVPEKDTRKLISAIEQFIGLTYGQKRAMGIEARELVKGKFDRQIVVEAYMEEIKNAVV